MLNIIFRLNFKDFNYWRKEPRRWRASEKELVRLESSRLKARKKWSKTWKASKPTESLNSNLANKSWTSSSENNRFRWEWKRRKRSKRSKSRKWKLSNVDSARRFSSWAGFSINTTRREIRNFRRRTNARRSSLSWSNRSRDCWSSCSRLSL